MEADWKLEMNSNLNIIAKCYSVIYFGSITNSGLVNGIMDISAKIFRTNSLKGKRKSLGRSQTTKEILPTWLPFHLFSILKVSDHMSLTMSLPFWHCTRDRGERVYLFTLCNATKFHRFVLWAVDFWKFWKWHKTSQSRSKWIISIIAQSWIKHWVSNKSFKT